jgi:hypothetical protein
MKGVLVAMLTSVMLFAILSITFPMWSNMIGRIVTAAGGDEFTVLLVNSVFFIICLSIIGAIALYRNRPEIDMM